jgi:signal peptide peptidase SppA
MNQLQLLSAIFNGMWLMSAQDAQSLFPLIVQLLSGKDLPAADLKNSLPIAVSMSASGTMSYYNAWDDVPENSNSIIRVSGALMKNDWYSLGTASLKNIIREADAHPNIGGHILVFDTPGGTVDGTKAFADTIKATRKPIVSYVDELAASAGYWLASATDEIILASETSIVGSIGTMISFADIRGYFEQLGIKFHDIFATDSKDKNQTFLKALEGEYKPMQEQTLNPTNDIFLEAVQGNRPSLDKKTLTGKTYLAKDAIQLGMADAIGNFEFALQRLESLKTPASNPSTQNKNQEMFFNKKFAALTAALTVMLSLKEGEEMTDDHVEAVNAELKALGLESVSLVANSQLEEADAQISSLTAERDQAQAQVTAITEERDAAQALAAEYGAKPGAEHSTLENGKGDDLPDPNQTLIDNLPHNKALDSNPMFNHKS